MTEDLTNDATTPPPLTVERARRIVELLDLGGRHE